MSRPPAYLHDVTDVDVSRTVDGKGVDLIIVNAKAKAGEWPVELRIPVDVAEALQYALEQALR